MHIGILIWRSDQWVSLWDLSKYRFSRSLLGVLTKVDKIENGTESIWLRTFNNQTYKLDSGWYAVKLPATSTPWIEPREEERRFFESEEPWKSSDRSRLGSEQLAKHIFRLLTNLVARLFRCVHCYRLTLPSISRNITDKIDADDADLECLPIHTEQEAHQIILTVIDNFSQDFSDYIQGLPPKPFSMEVGLIFKVKQILHSMMYEVCKSTPRFCPTNKPQVPSEELNDLLWEGLDAKGEIKYIDEVIEMMKKWVDCLQT